MNLKPTTLTITNKSTSTYPLYIYVPNMYNVIHEMEAGEVITVTTKQAGETFMYLNQAKDGVLTVVDTSADA